MRIYTEVAADSMGDGWRDNDEAAGAFADHLRRSLEAEFPGAEIEVALGDGLRGPECDDPSSAP